MSRSASQAGSEAAPAFSNIFAAGQCLESVQAARLALPLDDDEEDVFDALYDRNWAIREKIEASPAASPAEIAVKIKAALIALEGDPEVDMRGPGSYLSLTQAIMRDIMALAAVPA